MRRVVNYVRNCTSAQLKVREATTNEPWGPANSVMSEIADLASDHGTMIKILEEIIKRLQDHGKNWRRVYKALVLLDYMIKTNTRGLVEECRSIVCLIEELRNFEYVTKEGKDEGVNVREKAIQVLELLLNPEKLAMEQQRALKAKAKLYGGTSNIEKKAGVATAPPAICEASADSLTKREQRISLDCNKSNAESLNKVRSSVVLHEKLSELEKSENRDSNLKTKLKAHSKTKWSAVVDLSLAAKKLCSPPQVSTLDTYDVKTFTEDPFAPTTITTSTTGKSFTVDPFTPAAATTKAFTEDPFAHTASATNDPFIPAFSFDASVPKLSTNQATVPSSNKYANLSGLFDESKMSNSMNANVVKSFEEEETAAFKPAADQFCGQDFPITTNRFLGPSVQMQMAFDSTPFTPNPISRRDNMFTTDARSDVSDPVNLFASFSSAVSSVSNKTVSTLPKSDVSSAVQRRLGEDFWQKAANVKFDNILSTEATDFVKQSPAINTDPFGFPRVQAASPYNKGTQNQFTVSQRVLNPPDPPAIPPRRGDFIRGALQTPVYLQSQVADHLILASSQSNATLDSFEVQSMSPPSYPPPVIMESPSLQQPTHQNNEHTSTNPFY